MKNNKYNDQASFYSVGLLLGLLSGRTVIEWAKNLIENENEINQSLIEIYESSEWEITKLRYSLLDLCGEDVSNKTIIKILIIIEEDLIAGKRSVDDTLTVLTQLRRFVKINTIISEQIKEIEVLTDSKEKEDNIRKMLSNYKMQI